ncbi:MAG: Uma2 family endonuclease [Chloroflexota bacterium]
MAVSSSPHLLPRRFSVSEYEQLCDSGIVGFDERLELLDGIIVRLFPRDAAHIWAVSRLLKMLVWDDDTVLSPLNPLQMGERTMLRPDVAVVWASTPRTRAPEPGDMPLVIEVAEQSLEYDRLTKGPLYARASIPEYWIVDLNGEQIEVYTEPSEAGYRAMRRYLRGETLTPGFAPALAIQTDTILGEPESADGEPETPTA